jgi:hypothetical protein
MICAPPETPLVEISPLPFLAVGLLAAAGVAFFVVCGQILKKQMTARAVELLGKGASPTQATQQLIHERFDPSLSAQIVEKAIHRAEIDHATALLERGASVDEAQNELMATGMTPQKAKDVAGEAAFFRWCHRWSIPIGGAGLFLVASAVALIFTGLILRDGNRTGRFVTFPYAGGLTIAVGIAVLSIGCVLLVGVFKKTF